MTLEEASKFLGITRSHVSALLESGILSSLSEQDVTDFLPEVFHSPKYVQLVNTSELTGLSEEIF